MGKWARIRTITGLAVIGLALMATLVMVVYKWPRIAFSVIYLAVCLVLIVRSIRRVFFFSWRMDTWNTLLVDLASTDLSSDPPLTRLRRRLSASLISIAHAVLWPTEAVRWLAFRPFYRRDSLRQFVPRIRRPTILAHGQFLLGAALFAPLPVSILTLPSTGHLLVDSLLTRALVVVLAINLFARHTAMLLFPDDLKASMRRTVVDPRVFFFIVLCIDTFAFAVIVQYLALQSGIVAPSPYGFTRVIVDLISVSEVRGLAQEIKGAFEVGGTNIGGDVLAVLTKVTPLQAVQVLCSGFVYVNLVRMLLPLQSWKQTDDDLKFLARGFLIAGAPEQARTYLERVQDYDVEAAKLDALVAASQGDLQAAAQKVRWAHARDALPDDPDLIFLDAVGPIILIPMSGIDVGRCVAFALETQVSDVILAVNMFLINRIDPREALAILRAQDRIDAYPLSTATLEIMSGDQESARNRLDVYVASDIVSRCATILLKEVSASISLPSPAPSIYHAAEEVAQAIDAVDTKELPLSRQLTLVSILTGIRFAVAHSGGSTASLELRTSTILTTIRQHHPSHRDLASRLANFGRVSEAQFRDKRERG